MSEAPPSLREKYGYLPAVLTMLVETVGEDAMLKISAALGGTRLSLGPESWRRSPLPELLGYRMAKAIFDRARQDGLLRLDIPRMGPTLALRRRQRVLRLRAEGTKVSEIALALHMTERNIYYVLAEDRDTPDPRQMLFPFIEQTG